MVFPVGMIKLNIAQYEVCFIVWYLKFLHLWWGRLLLKDDLKGMTQVNQEALEWKALKDKKSGISWTILIEGAKNITSLTGRFIIKCSKVY